MCTKRPCPFEAVMVLSLAEMIRRGSIICKEYINHIHLPKVFQYVGLVGHQPLVAYNTLSKVGLQYIVNAPDVLPSLLELHSAFPRNALLPIDEMFAPIKAQL